MCHIALNFQTSRRMDRKVVSICRDCNAPIYLYSLAKDREHQNPCFGESDEYCSNLGNPPERFCKNVSWLCESCYYSTAESVHHENNDCKCKSQSPNQIETRYTNLLDLDKTCLDLVQRGELQHNKPYKYCTNLENPPEPFCENVIWLCQNCYHSAVKSVNRDNNDCKSKSESPNQIETRYTNLIDLEKRIEALERHLKACPDLVQRATVAEANSSATQYKAAHTSMLNRRVIIPIAAITVSIILIGMLLFIEGRSGFFNGNKGSLQGIPNATMVPRPNSLMLISRDEWSAQTKPDGMQKLQLPIERIIIAHISTAQCENRVQCDARVRGMQAFHIHSNGWGDIGYNFLIGGDGLVYEGRGWYNQGAHTTGYNGNSICIAFIGTFNVEVPTENDLKAAQLLIDEGVRLGVLTGNYRLYGARQLTATESPGKALYSIIMKWPHWSRRI